jgi:hypothetical protein
MDASVAMRGEALHGGSQNGGDAEGIAGLKAGGAERRE